jgi:hypothetical protein
MSPCREANCDVIRTAETVPEGNALETPQILTRVNKQYNLAAVTHLSNTCLVGGNGIWSVCNNRMCSGAFIESQEQKEGDTLI